VRDEQATVEQLIASIDAQTSLPAEVIFVDGGSKDNTVDILRRKTQEDPRYRLVQADGPATPGRGRNLGVGAARHAWIAMTDAGITVEPGWLQALWKAQLGNPGAAVVYGNHEFDVRSFFEECAAVAYCRPKIQTPAGMCRGESVVSLLIRKEVFHAVGGFPDLRSGEDDMFLRAVADAGTVAAWAPDATVWWRLRPDITATFERFRAYSYSNVIARQERYWHRRLARNYVPVALGVGLAVTRSPGWLGLSGATLVGRTALRVARFQSELPDLRPPSPTRFGMIGFILAASDLATALGWWQARRDRGLEPAVLKGGGQT